MSNSKPFAKDRFIFEGIPRTLYLGLPAGDIVKSFCKSKTTFGCSYSNLRGNESKSSWLFSRYSSLYNSKKTRLDTEEELKFNSRLGCNFYYKDENLGREKEGKSESSLTNCIRNISRDAFSATFGSICCCYVGQPFDTVKVRMQINPALYSGVMETTFLTLRQEGAYALWKGSVPTVIGMSSENIAAFGINEALKRSFPAPTTPSDEIPNLSRFFSMGFITGIFAAVADLPAEVIKARTQIQIGSGSSSHEILRYSIKKRGIKSLFCGLDAHVIRDGPFYACFFGGYELNCYFLRKLMPSIPDELNYFLSGGFAGMMSWIITMPLDAVKTCIQARYDTKVWGSFLPTLSKIVKQRGILGLYNGLGPTLARAFPANAALFLGVEVSKKVFDETLWAENI